MPNWIKGSIKFRGPYENILRFYQEGINIYEHKVGPDVNDCCMIPVPKSDWLEINESGEPGNRVCDIYFNRTNITNDWAHVEGTNRAFIFEEEIFIDIHERSYSENKNAISTISVAEVAQAWGFRSEEWLEIAKKYDIDIHLYGFERGIQFGQEIEIVNGEIVKDDVMHYDDWDWECPFPWIGG